MLLVVCFFLREVWRCVFLGVCWLGVSVQRAGVSAHAGSRSPLSTWPSPGHLPPAGCCAGLETGLVLWFHSSSAWSQLPLPSSSLWPPWLTLLFFLWFPKLSPGHSPEDALLFVVWAFGAADIPRPRAGAGTITLVQSTHILILSLLTVWLFRTIF